MFIRVFEDQGLVHVYWNDMSVYLLRLMITNELFSVDVWFSHRIISLCLKEPAQTPVKRLLRISSLNMRYMSSHY